MVAEASLEDRMERIVEEVFSVNMVQRRDDYIVFSSAISSPQWLLKGSASAGGSFLFDRFLFLCNQKHVMCDLSQGHLCGLRPLCISSWTITVMHIGTDITDFILTFNHTEVDGILQKTKPKHGTRNTHFLHHRSIPILYASKRPGLISHQPSVTYKAWYVFRDLQQHDTPCECDLHTGN